MNKNLKTPAVGEWKLPRVETFSCKTTFFFKMDPSARKLQESGNTQNKRKKITQHSKYVHKQPII